MRTKNSYFNIVANTFVLLSRTLALFILRTAFIKILGEEYLGVNGLFTNILSMLSLAELGIGTAITFSLYKPLANDNIKEVSAIMAFYKKVYKLIGITIAILGLILLPFIPMIVGKTVVKNVILIYLLYLFNTVSLYFISYKDTLIVADQKNYKLAGINFISFMTMYFLQFLALILFKSFILYLLMQIIVAFIQRNCINRFISKQYPKVDFNSKEKIKGEDINVIKINIKSMIYHKIGNQLVDCTDNIIISKFVSIVAVGLYTNYLSLISMVNTILFTVINSVTASFGNLVVLEKEHTQEKVFDLLNFLGFVIFGYAAVCFAILFNPFIEIWIGKKYLLSVPIVLIICINFYLKGMRYPLDTVKEASGIYKQDRYIPILQAIINLIVSIVLAIKFGLIGVLLGTTISFIILPCWNRPYIVYKYAFKSSPKKYYLNYIYNTFCLVLIYLIINTFINFLNLKVSILSIILTFIIVTIVFFLLISLIYFRSDNFKFYINFIKKKIKQFGFKNKKIV